MKELHDVYSDSDMIKLCRREIELLNLGKGRVDRDTHDYGKDWTMSIPVQWNDHDVLFAELINRFEQYIQYREKVYANNQNVR